MRRKLDLWVRVNTDVMRIAATCVKLLLAADATRRHHYALNAA